MGPLEWNGTLRWSPNFWKYSKLPLAEDEVTGDTGSGSRTRIFNSVHGLFLEGPCWQVSGISWVTWNFMKNDWLLCSWSFFLRREYLAFTRCTKWIQACPLPKRWKEPLVYKVWYEERVEISSESVMKSSVLFISKRMSTKSGRVGSKNGPRCSNPFKWTLLSLTEQIVIKLLFAMVLDSCTLSHWGHLPTNQWASKKIIKFSSS